ncbi:MAG: hypothetical protein KDA65_17950 [Planctomycetaceae bacterium]|nr:hypothetical protein [Planctomycetaceae bacterium]
MSLDYRKTLFRDHISRILEQRENLDILAVEEILRNIEACNCVDANGVRVDRWHPDVIAAVNYREFFYRDMPDERIYIPLRVSPAGNLHLTDSLTFNRYHAEYVERASAYRARHQDSEGTKIPFPPPQDEEFDSYPDLSVLIYELNRRWQEAPNTEQRGILLLSQSGAGKTSACWKAFYDCLYDITGDRVSFPMLSGFLPSWLSLDVVSEDVDPVEMVLDQIAITATGSTSKRLRNKISRYLKTGPPLLMFADLNPVSEKRQLPLAHAFSGFQKEFGKFGHRLVITYRSNQADSAPMKVLKDPNSSFGIYDLLPVETDQAKSYLANKHRFELELSNKNSLGGLGISFVENDIDLVLKVFDSLSNNFTRMGISSNESLISTPLLMHFVSILPVGTLHEGSTLYDLYQLVIDRHFEREMNSRTTIFSRSDFSDHAIKTETLILMTRVALAIQARGADVTRLPAEQLMPLFTCPTTDPLTGMTPDWRPDDDYWSKSPIYEKAYVSKVIDNDGLSWPQLMKMSLLKQTENEVSFIHDSLIYYFCGAISLVEHQRPSQAADCDSEWCQKVGERINPETELWIKPGPFIAHRLHTIDLHLAASRRHRGNKARKDILLAELVRAGRTEEWFDLLNLFTACLAEIDELYETIAQALHAHPGYLRKEPTDLPAEIARYLLSLPERSDRLQNFLDFLLGQK